MEWTKLLAPKGLAEFSPEDFKNYVRSLYVKRVARKTKTIRVKKTKPPYVWSITKTGKLSVKVNRPGRWLSREDLAQIAQESGTEERLVWLQTVSRKRNPIRLSTPEAEGTITP